MKLDEAQVQKEWEISKESVDEGSSASDAALSALLEEGEGAEQDAERRVRQLGSRLAQLDALNVGGMLGAATEGRGPGAALAARLDGGLQAGAALTQRLARLEQLGRAAPHAAHARSGAARADANARALLAELEAIYSWLEPPALRDLDSLQEPALTTPEGRAAALRAALALRHALRAEPAQPPHRRRLAAVRERLRRLARAKEQMAAALARHLNNALIHLGNEAAHEARPHKHHAELLPYAPFMRWLKDMDEKAYDGLLKVYTSTWSRVLEREVRGAGEGARGALQAAPDHAVDNILDQVLSLVESLCNAEQDFCTQFFFLDVDVKNEGSDGERSEGGGEGKSRQGAESRRLMAELFPNVENELVALVGHVEKHDAYGAMRALACVGRRVRRPHGGGPPGRAAGQRQAGGAAAQVRRVRVHPGAGGAERGVRADLRGERAARRRGALVPVAGRRHGALRVAGGAPAHAAARAAARELPPAAGRPGRAAPARAGRAAPRVSPALHGRAPGLRHAVLRSAAREAHAVLRGRVRGRGVRRARGRGLLPRRLQQARVAPRARHVPGARGAQVAAPAVPHGGEARERGGRVAAGGVARHAGGVHRAARGAAGSHVVVLRRVGSVSAAEHAGHPGRVLRHRAGALTAAGAAGTASTASTVRLRAVLQCSNEYRATNQKQVQLFKVHVGAANNIPE